MPTFFIFPQMRHAPLYVSTQHRSGLLKVANILTNVIIMILSLCSGLDKWARKPACPDGIAHGEIIQQPGTAPSLAIPLQCVKQGDVHLLQL